MEFRTLRAEEIDCRISQIDKNWCTLLLYKDARVDMNVLDETVGCMNWKKSYLRDNANCVVSIWNNDIKEWVSKEDTGTESFSEAEKGLASDSFKRACFNWGIGRELYTAPSILIFPRPDMKRKTKEKDANGDPIYEPEFFEKGNGKYDTKTRFWVEIIDYDNDRNIKDLIIRDQKNNVRFSQTTKELDDKLLKLDTLFNETITKYEGKKNMDRKEILEDLFKIKEDTQVTYKQKKQFIEMIRENK